MTLMEVKSQIFFRNMVKLLNTLVLFFLFAATQAQVAIIMTNEVDKFAVAHAPEQNQTSASTYSSNVVTNAYSTIELEEKQFVPEILKSETSRLTYSDLNKLAQDPKSNYLHPETKTLFPYDLGQFERKQIIAYPNDPGKLLAIYSDKSGKSSIVLSLTPTQDAKEGRLRNEYLKEIRKLSKEVENISLPKPQVLKFRGRNFSNNGVSGTYYNKKEIAQVTVYECGAWLLGMKVKTQGVDSLNFAKMTEELTQQFNPSRYTALSPLNLKSNVEFNREAMKDTVMSSALANSAFKKMNWAADNVGVRERHSGFPDIYLNMHIAALEEYMRIQGRKKSLSKSAAASEFYNDILALKNADFLAEYIMEQYEEVMNVPPNTKLDFEAYRQWKQGKTIRTRLTDNRYTIIYRNLPY